MGLTCISHPYLNVQRRVHCHLAPKTAERHYQTNKRLPKTLVTAGAKSSFGLVAFNHDGIMGRARGHFLLASLLLRGWLVASPRAGLPA